MKLSLALATYNEESNIKVCIESCRGLVDEIVIVDGSSTDKTIEIAKSLGANVIVTSNPSMFHINKQKAIDACIGDWILQLDADERVTPALAEEIKKIIVMSEKELEIYEDTLPEKDLFERHQSVIASEAKQSHYQQTTSTFNGIAASSRQVGTPRNDNIVAFLIPRLNFFLGKYLRYGGVYPDGVIRLFKKGKAHLPCKDVHELMEVEGSVGWLQNPLRHIDSPTFSRYLERNSRYIDLLAEELKDKSQVSNHKSQTNFKFQIQNFKLFFNYMFFKPLSWFFMTTFRHKGILDGWQGVVFSVFSALRFPRAYWRYIMRLF